MYRFYLILFLLLVSCKSVSVVNADEAYIDVRLNHVHIENSTIKGYLQIYEFTDMPGIINEIHRPNGRTLVEYFKTPDGSFPFGQRDTHSISGTVESHTRYVYTYPAEVIGADFTYRGFAEIPQNQDGTVVTNTDPASFNAKYNSNHDRRGRVVRDYREHGRWWSVTFDSSDASFLFIMDDKPMWAE